MSTDRREALRIPDSRLITEIVQERPNAASIVNLSETGVFTVRPTGSGGWRSRLVQMEIPLPEAGDSLWAVGKVVFQNAGPSCVGSGIRFVTMADYHWRLIRDVIHERRQDIMEQMMLNWSYRQDSVRYPFGFTPFATPSPPPTTDTAKMYLIPEQQYYKN